MQEQDECLFYQLHPIAHAGSEFDYSNDDVPAHFIGSYSTIYKWKHKNKRLQVDVNGSQILDGYIFTRDSIYRKYTTVMFQYFSCNFQQFLQKSSNIC